MENTDYVPVTQLDRIEAKLDAVVAFIDAVSAVAAPMLPPGALTPPEPGVPLAKPW